MEAEAKKRLCENCGRALKGRSDQRFCDDSCRNTFNHKARVPDNEVTNPVINILKRNRTVLSNIFTGTNRTFTKLQMVSIGYDFDYCTGRRTLQGSEFYFCFDYGYELLADDKYEIISLDYFDFIYAHYQNILEQIPAPDYSDAADVAHYEMLNEPLRINSELKDLPDKKRKANPNIRVI
jgi:hypothetical protein